MRRLRHGALVVFFYLAVAAVYTYPLVLHLPTAILRGYGGDLMMETSIVAWNARQILHDPLGVHDLPFYYPYSHTVAYQQPEFFIGLLAAPLMAVGASPLFVVNLFIVAALVASGALTYLLAYSITGRVLPSLLAGMVYAFFTNRMDHLGQFTYQMAALPPLILWILHRVLQRGARWRDLALLVAALWAQALSGIYQAFGLAFVLSGFVAAFLLLRPAALTLRLVCRGALALALLIVVLAPFLGPYSDQHRELGLKRDVGEAEWYGMDLLSLFDPGVFNTAYGKRLMYLTRSEGGLFPGFVALGLVAVALGSLAAGPAAGPPRWISRLQRILAAGACLCVIVVVVVAAGNLHLPARAARVGLHDLTLPVNILPALALAAVALEGRRRRGGPLIAREWVLVALFLAVLAYLLTLAPTIKIAEHPWGTAPFRWVYFHIPGAAAFRAPGRWSLAFALPLGLLVAFGANALGNRFSRRRGVMLGALLAAMVVELNVCPLPWTRLPPVPLVYAWLGAQPGDFAVLELPMAEGAVDDWAMFWAANTSWKLLVNGGGGFPLATAKEIVGATRPVFDPPGFAHAVQQIVPLRYIVVHPDPSHLAERFREMRIPGIRLVGQQGLDDVYELTVAPETGIDFRRYFSSTFARAHPTGEFVLRFTGDDPDVTQFVEVSLNGRLLPGIRAAGAGTLTLPPPFRAADRNELRFLHRYQVRPDVTGSAAVYRIGTTGVRSPADVEIISEGRDQAGRGGLVSAHVNGHEVVDLPRRGYNVVALDGGDGRVLWSDNFDTFRSESESRRMAERIDALPAGTIVIAGVKTDGGGRLTAEGVAALRSVGGQRDLRGTLWVSHALIGVKGAPAGSAVETAGAGRVMASVGRARPLAATLETFTLR